MLVGIGIIIILKQLPHAFGSDPDFEGDEAFFQIDGENSYSELFSLINHVHLGCIVQAAWRNGQDLTLHGRVYGLNSGFITDLNVNISSEKDLDKVYQLRF